MKWLAELKVQAAIGGVLLAGLVALLWLYVGAAERVGELEAKLAQQAQETREAADANDTNMATIEALQDALWSCTAKAEADRVRQSEELIRRSEELSAAISEADRLRRMRDEERRRKPQCAEFSALAVDQFCPAAAMGLRERSRGPDRNED